MMLAIRLVDLGAFLSLGMLWMFLGTFIVMLYRWLWQHRQDDGIEQL